MSDREMSYVNAQKNGLCGRLIDLVKPLLEPDASSADPFPMQQKLSELGLGSLGMLNLMLAVESEFGIAISPADITLDNFHSLASVEALVERTLNSLSAR